MGRKGRGSKSSARSQHAGRTLWSERTGGRYFLLPDDLQMVAVIGDGPPPEGMFEIGTLGGRRRLVRDEDVRSYEVPSDQAVEWIWAEFSPEIETLKAEAIERAERLLEESAPPPDGRTNKLV